MDFTGYSSKRMLELFEEITRIPRSSYNEEEIALYICSFAKARGLWYYKDEKHNVLVKLPGTPGRECESAVLLQGHTDMVCEADFGVEWDPKKEGVSAYVDGDFIKANGTTLGADDGAAVAAMLSVLDGALDSHGPLECLFTTCEEVGLDGAKFFDASLLSARKMINLDSECDSEAIISCAGGVRTDISMKADLCSFDRAAIKITVKGLAGGHSGADIHLGRSNAVKILARVLKTLMRDTKNNVAEIFGGTKDNAIPRSAYAVLSVKDVASVKDTVYGLVDSILADLSDEDASEFEIVCERTEAPELMCEHEVSVALVNLLGLLPSGVMGWIDEDAGEVESSCNIGIVTTDEHGFNITVSSRSNDEKKLDNLEYILENFAVLYGCELRHKGRYPGWKNADASPIESLYKKKYRELFGEHPRTCAIHAGLECGIFKKAIPDMDIISIGPNMYDIHTPRERLSLSSCDRFFSLLRAMLGESEA